MADITIVTVNWHSSNLIQQLLQNLMQKSSEQHNLRCLIIDNTNGIEADLAGLKNNEIPCSFLPNDCGALTGSKAHAQALNRAMETVQSEFILVVDPDVHIFAKNWDSLCIDALAINKAWAIGAPYPQWKVGKYHNFPSPVFCLFRRELADQLTLDWRPFSQYYWRNAGIFVIRQIGRLGGALGRRTYERSFAARTYAHAVERLLGTFSQDTGWRISEEARKKNLALVVFDSLLPQHATGINSPPDPVWCDLAKEFELFAFRSRPVLVHRYSTKGRPWRTTKGGDESFWQKSIENAEGLLAIAN